MVGSFDTLAFWSLVALVLRVLAIAGFIHVLVLQLIQFKNKEVYQHENQLKRLLTVFVAVIALPNIPILVLHFDRIRNHPASSGVTSFETVSNAVAMLIVAILLILIYRFRSDDIDGER